MRRKPGYRNINELSKEEIDIIVNEYYNSTKKVSELADMFKLTKRTLPEIFKRRGIDSHKKNRYTLNESYFKNITTERQAYWLGYLYADGFVGDNKYNNVIFSQKESDSYVVKQFAKDINFTGKLRKAMPGAYENGQHQIVINFSSKKMANDLRALGLYPGKSMTMKDLPDIDDKLFPHFIRGYFDGDGSIMEFFRNQYKDRVYTRYTWNIIGTVPFIKKIAELLPIQTYIRDSKTPAMKYLMTSRGKSMPMLYDFLYKDSSFYLKRKHDIFYRASGFVDKRLSKTKMG